MIQLRQRLARSRLVWRAYHAAFADPSAVERLSKTPVVRRLLADLDLGRLLDVGCGGGTYTRWFADHARGVTSVDVDQAGLSRLAAREEGKSGFARAACPRLPFRTGSFDTVVAFEVLEHIQDDAGAVRELARLCRPRGRLVISVPVPPGEIDDPVHKPFGHKREGYTREQLDALLGAAGFTVQRHGFCLLFPSRVALSVIGLVHEVLGVYPPAPAAWPAALDRALPGDPARWRPYCQVAVAERTAP